MVLTGMTTIAALGASERPVPFPTNMMAVRGLAYQRVLGINLKARDHRPRWIVQCHRPVTRVCTLDLFTITALTASIISASNNRSPADPSRPLGPGQGQGQNPTNNLTSLLSNFSSNPQRAAASNTNQQHHSDFEPPPPSTGDIPASQKPEDMSESDRYGLAGFLARIRSEDPMVAGLARGQDLTQLGLNLSSPE